MNQKFQLNISSVPSGAAILRDGNPTGFVTPKTFTQASFVPGVYSARLDRYAFNPALVNVPSLNANQKISFLGTCVEPQLTVSSTPPGANIFVNGRPTGFQTPHTFDFGAYQDGLYSVEKAGFGFQPAEANVSLLRQDLALDFAGFELAPVLTVLSDPSGAAITVDGSFTGFLTPYTYPPGGYHSGSYRVYKDGYRYDPDYIDIPGLAESTTLRFTGIPLQPSLTIVSEPSGAAITVDGVFTGYLTPHSYPPGGHRDGYYRVYKDGYYFKPQEVEVVGLAADTRISFTGVGQLGEPEEIKPGTPAGPQPKVPR